MSNSGERHDIRGHEVQERKFQFAIDSDLRINSIRHSNSRTRCATMNDHNQIDYVPLIFNVLCSAVGELYMKIIWRSWWLPANEQQSNDRCKRKTITVQSANDSSWEWVEMGPMPNALPLKMKWIFHSISWILLHCHLPPFTTLPFPARVHAREEKKSTTSTYNERMVIAHFVFCFILLHPEPTNVTRTERQKKWLRALKRLTNNLIFLFISIWPFFLTIIYYSVSSTTTQFTFRSGPASLTGWMEVCARVRHTRKMDARKKENRLPICW